MTSFFFRNLAVVLACASVQSAELPPQLWLDTTYTVSGISSGAFMAVQMSTIFSSRVAGAGVFAGGPFYCSKGLSYRLSYCTAFPSVPGVGRLADEVDELAAAVRDFANKSVIDAWQNILKQRFFLFSGTLDSVVAPVVPATAAAVWRALGVANASIVTKFDLEAGHTFPTIDHGGSCTSSSAPYVGSCGFDGVGALFAHIVPGGVPVPRNAKPNLSRIIKVDQASFVPNGTTLYSTDLASDAYLFLPPACADATKRCRLHVAFHGCTQAGETFPRLAGFAEWAETNDIVVLFPQISGHGSNLLTGCWDFTGSYTSASFYRRDGWQTSTIARLIDHLSSGTPKTTATQASTASLATTITTSTSGNVGTDSTTTTTTTTTTTPCEPACASGQLCVQNKCYAEVGPDSTESSTDSSGSTETTQAETIAPSSSAASTTASGTVLFSILTMISIAK